MNLEISDCIMTLEYQQALYLKLFYFHSN